LTKARFGKTDALTHLNISGNRIETLNLYDSPNLVNVNCSNNSIVGIDISSRANLQVVDCSNNGSSYLNIGGNPNLTGFYGTGNRFPQIHIDSALSGLVAGGKYSGYANFSGSSGVSSVGYGYANTLTGRFWNVGYQYYPILPNPPETVPSISPSWPTSYPINVSIGLSHLLACAIVENVACHISTTGLATGTVVNFADSGAIDGYQIGTQFYIQNSNSTILVQKVCCDIASYVSGPTSCLPSPSPSVFSPSAPSLPSDPSPSNSGPSASPPTFTPSP
jgi:hypothetical protein